MAAVFCFSLSAAVMWFLIRPHFDENESGVSASPVIDSVLSDQRERCVQVLKDLELDLATGKLNAEEYARMRASVGHELLSIVDRLKN